jgi:thymidylate synthase
MYAMTIMETSAMKAWERAMLFIANSPEKLKFGGGTEVKHALDSQVTIILDKNAVDELLNEQWHPSDPFCTVERVKAYKAEYKKEFPADTFDYTYRNILEEGFWIDEFSVVDQIGILRVGLQKQIDEQMGSNRNVAVLFNPGIDNFSGKAIPCLNEILVRWEKEGYCSIHTTFRSHDMSAWNANMLALTKFIYEEIVKPCGCKILYWSEHNYSLHIYLYDLHIVNEMVKVNRSPALISRQALYDNTSSGNIIKF